MQPLRRIRDFNNGFASEKRRFIVYLSRNRQKTLSRIGNKKPGSSSDC